MNNEEFEERLLSENPDFKLPDFHRAEEDDIDYPDLSLPQRDIAVPYSQYPLTYEDIKNGQTNFACAKRHCLRYMSVEEYKAVAYVQPDYAVYQGSWPPIAHSGVSDFELYG
jgi:hypothetical protein